MTILIITEDRAWGRELCTRVCLGGEGGGVGGTIPPLPPSSSSSPNRNAKSHTDCVHDSTGIASLNWNRCCCVGHAHARQVSGCESQLPRHCSTRPGCILQMDHQQAGTRDPSTSAE